MNKKVFLGSLFILALSLTACGQSAGGGSDAFAFNDSELNTAQEIHTKDQKAFLDYRKNDSTKSYYKITSAELNSFNAKGNTNVSTPNAVKLNWTYSGKKVDHFSVVFGQKADLSDGYEVDGTDKPTISIYNSFLGDNYFKVVANFANGKKEESPIKVFKVDATCPRNLKVGNMPNCRDMGGRTTEAGGKIKQGLIYRTSGSKFDNSTASNAEAKKVLLNQFKVKTEINVANSDTNNVDLKNGVTLQNCYMAYGSVPYSNLARNSVRIRQIMDILSEEKNYPVFYHCRIGTDRTGITGVMIGGLLGIPFEEILQDYLFSNFAPIDNQRYPGKTPDSNGDDICKYIDELLALPGSNFQEKTYLALRMIGVPAAKLDNIINIMTEGKKATIPNSAKIGEGDGLTTDGTKKTSTNYKEPASYCALANGKKASFQTTTEAGKKNVILYLGYTGTISTSTKTKLADSLTLKIDGEEKAIQNTKNLWEAGFGSTQQDGRIGYMFNNLGEYDFTAGQHTVEIVSKDSTFNVASINIA